MSLYEQVKAAIRNGVPANHVAAAFGVSEHSVRRIETLLTQQKTDATVCQSDGSLVDVGGSCNSSPARIMP